MVQVEPVRALYTDTVVNLEPCFEVVAQGSVHRALMAEG